MFVWLIGCGAFGIYLTPHGETGLDSGVEDTGVAPAVDCSQAGFFGHQPEYASSGTVVGQVTSPNGLVGVGGASVTWDEAWAISQDHGCFVLDLPPGTHTLQVERGRYVGSVEVEVVEGHAVDVEIPLSSDVRMAVVYGKYDDVGELIGHLGVPFDGVVELGDVDDLDAYDALFVNCGGAGEYSDLDLLELRGWVEQGGTLYVSDWEWALFEGVVPEAVDFREDPRVGEAGSLGATILDRNIAAMLGSEEAEVAFDLPNWALMDDVDQATALVLARVDGADRPLAVDFRVGEGRVLFTSFHNEAQMTADMQVILYSLILSL